MEGLTAVPSLAITDALLLKLIDQGVATVCVVGLLVILYAVLVRFTREFSRLVDFATHRERENEDGENMADDPPKK